MNSKELVSGTIIDFDAPYPYPLGNGENVVLQRIYVQTPLDVVYDLPGRTAGRGEALLVVVCDMNLDFPGRSSYTLTTCEDVDAAALGLSTTAVWGSAYHGPGGVYYDATTQTYDVDNAPPQQVWLKGAYRSATDVPDRSSGPWRIHTFWPTYRIQPLMPTCGGWLRPGLDEDTTTILENRGIGLQSWDPALGDDEYTGTTGDGPGGGDIDDIVAGHFAPTGSGTAIDARELYRIPKATTPVTYDDVPIPVAYGRVNWDMLWHGTCVSDTSEDAWCLPDGHPRLALKRTRDVLANLIPASSCVDDVCHMDCPFSTEEDEARYDFHLIDDFLDAAFAASVDAGSPPADHFLGPSQRASIRIAPYDPDTTPPTSPPAWLKSCLSTGEYTEFTDGSGHDYWVPSYDTQALQDQLDVLVEALAGWPSGPSPYVETGIPGFDGYQYDKRVFSIDYGLVGSWGEWNQEGSNFAYRVPHTSTGTLTPLDAATGGAYEATPSGSTCTGTATAHDTWYDHFFAWFESAFGGVSGDVGVVGSPLLVGKLRYGDAPVGDEVAQCWSATSSTRLHTPLEASADLGAGVRSDAWGWEGLPEAGTGADEAFYLARLAEAGDNWKYRPYQLETLANITRLINHDSTGLNRWNYYDLDAMIQFAINGHFSGFSLKFDNLSHLFAAFDSGDLYEPSWCHCALRDGVALDHCAEEQVRRLLRETGPRIRIHSWSLPEVMSSANDLFTARIRFENDGNAPPYHFTRFRIRLWDPAASAWATTPLGTADPLAQDARWFVPRSQPCAASWADRASTSAPCGGALGDALNSYSTITHAYSCTSTETSTPVEPLVIQFGHTAQPGWVPPGVAGGKTLEAYMYFNSAEVSVVEPALQLAMTQTLATRHPSATVPGSEGIYYVGSLVVVP